MLIQCKHGQRISPTNITIGTDSIFPSESARNLGILFGAALFLSPHVSGICKAASYHLHKISRIRILLTLEASKTLVHSLITSCLDYCNSVLAGLPDSDIKHIQCIQNAAARLTACCQKFDHISPVLEHVHWLPIWQCIAFKVLVLTYKALRDMAPQYIVSLLTHYVPPRTLRSSAHALLNTLRYNTKSYGAQAFLQFAPAEYNKLPCTIKKSPTLAIFKSKLKTFLFKEAFD